MSERVSVVVSEAHVVTVYTYIHVVYDGLKYVGEARASQAKPGPARQIRVTPGDGTDSGKPHQEESLSPRYSNENE